MKILILSDSHSKTIDFNFSDFDYVIHAGDTHEDLEGRCIYAKGNCDYYGPNEVRVNLFDKKFYITHGHLYGVKNGYDRITYKGFEEEADFVIFGHTHIPYFSKERNTIFINPGAYLNGNYRILYDDHIEYYEYSHKEIINF